jgi:hypothetical protein
MTVVLAFQKGWCGTFFGKRIEQAIMGKVRGLPEVLIW